MGFLDGDFFGGSSSNYGGTSRQRSHSNTRSTSGRSGYYARPSNTHTHTHTNNRSGGSSFFGGAAGSSSNHHQSSRGFFSSNGSGGSSHYKRRPRDGYINYLVNRLQRLLRDLWQYFRRHPVKAFFAVIVPLISAGGAVGGLIKAMGIRIPPGMSSVFATGGSNRGGGGYYGSRGYGGSSSSGLGGMFGGGEGGGGLMDNAGEIYKIAKMFM
jgi:hypothetical protein